LVKLGYTAACRAGTRRRARSCLPARAARCTAALASGPPSCILRSRAIPRFRTPRSGALRGALKSREPRATSMFALRPLARAARRACRRPRSGTCAHPCFEAKPPRLARLSSPIKGPEPLTRAHAGPSPRAPPSRHDRRPGKLLFPLDPPAFWPSQHLA
jgi:hypothetical protein